VSFLRTLRTTRLMPVAAAAVLALGAAACDDDNGDDFGDEVEDTVDDAGDELEDLTDDDNGDDGDDDGLTDDDDA
jgi:hypothetical protein